MRNGFHLCIATLAILLSLGVLIGCGGASPLSAKVTLMSIVVTPAAPTIGKGTTEQFKSTGMYSDATSRDISSTVTWASATPATATISPKGLATGLAPGTTLITATSGTISGQAALTVTPGPSPPLVSIVVTPATLSIGVGMGQQLTASGTFADNSIKDLTELVTWTSAAPFVATISATGEVTGVASGTTTITATSGAVSGSTTLTVITGRRLVSIAVTPSNPLLNTGTKLQFTATGTFADNTTQDLTTTATWASGTPSIATISPGGEATGLLRGRTAITATSGTISGSTTLEVTTVPLISIKVTPTSSKIANGTKQQFTATGTFVDASTQDLTTMVTWASATPATATITATGEATGLSAGTTVISATLGALSGNTTLTVMGGTLISIAVIPATPTITKGDKLQLTAIGVLDDNTTQDFTSKVTWTSSNLTTATISNAAGTNGQATGGQPGTTVISATVGTISGSVMLTVVSGALVAIVVTPATPIVTKGSKVQFTATAMFADGAHSTLDWTSMVPWESSSAATATISNAAGSAGQATALAEGTTIISTMVFGFKGTATLTVTSP